MSLLDDRLAALGRIEESVYGRVKKGQRPELLARTLFGLLRHAVEREGVIGGQLSLATAAKNLGTTTTSTSFKTAIDRIAEELQRCRDAREIPRAEDLPGVACVEAYIEGKPHLVFVRGPRSSHRGDRRDQLLRLKIEFRPIAEGLSTSSADGPTPAQETASNAATSESRQDQHARRGSSLRILVVGSLVVFAIVAISVVWRLTPRAQSPVRPFSLTLPSETSEYYDAYGGRVAPDGKRIAFLARSPSSCKRFLFVREIDAERADQVEESAGDYTPFFWSHDGKSLYFVTEKFLKQKRIGQKPIKRIARLDGAPRGTVNRDGVILLGSTTGILRVFPGGRVSPITIANAGESHTVPYFLPDGVTFLFLAISRPTDGEAVKTLCSARLDAPHRIRRIGPMWSRVEWNADHLLYVRDGALYARPWSLEYQSFTGREVLVKRAIWSNTLTNDADFSVARDGFLVVKDQASRSRFVRIRPGARPSPISWPGQVVGITIARDRELAVIASQEKPGRTDLWVWDLKDDSRRKLTSFGTNTSPVLTAAGDTVYYAADRQKVVAIYRMSIATNVETEVRRGTSTHNPRGISSDGELLLYAIYRSLDSDLYCINLQNGRIIPIANSPNAREGETGRFSPDGTQLVYVSDVSGEQRVYVAPYPPKGAPGRIISPPCGWRARWSHDGEKIYFLQRRKLFEYDVRTRLAREVYEADFDISHMEPAPRGEFLVVFGPVEPPNRIVSNWREAVGKE